MGCAPILILTEQYYVKVTESLGVDGPLRLDCFLLDIILCNELRKNISLFGLSDLVFCCAIGIHLTL